MSEVRHETTETMKAQAKEITGPMIRLYEFENGEVCIPHPEAQSVPTYLAFLTDKKRYLGFRFEADALGTNFFPKLEYAVQHFAEKSFPIYDPKRPDEFPRNEAML